MSSFKITSRKGISPFDWLLILGLVLAPMTELRIWKVGPSELLCALWSTKYIRGFLAGGLNHYLRRFWLLFYLTITAGMLYCLIFYPTESSGLDGLFTWFFMMYISLGIYAGLKQHSLGSILNILEKACMLATVWYLFLFVYSRTVNPFFFGARLWYAKVRFTGGGANPHQMAVLALGLFFVTFYFLARVKLTRRRKILYFAMMAAQFYILRLTKSTTALMGLVTALFVGIILVSIMHRRGVRDRQTTAILLISFSVLLVFATFLQLVDRFMAWVALDPNGLHRFQLFADIIDPIKKNILFGLGDGTHANFGRSEFHNSYLEIIGMSGLIGVIIFIAFTFRMIKNLWHDKFLLLLPLAYYIYGLSGFGLRRLPYWVLTVFMIAVSEKIKGNGGSASLANKIDLNQITEGI